MKHLVQSVRNVAPVCYFSKKDLALEGVEAIVSKVWKVLAEIVPSKIGKVNQWCNGWRFRVLLCMLLLAASGFLLDHVCSIEADTSLHLLYAAVYANSALIYSVRSDCRGTLMQVSHAVEGIWARWRGALSSTICVDRICALKEVALRIASSTVVSRCSRRRRYDACSSLPS